MDATGREARIERSVGRIADLRRGRGAHLAHATDADLRRFVQAGWPLTEETGIHSERGIVELRLLQALMDGDTLTEPNVAGILSRPGADLEDDVSRLLHAIVEHWAAGRAPLAAGVAEPRHRGGSAWGDAAGVGDGPDPPDIRREHGNDA